MMSSVESHAGAAPAGLEELGLEDLGKTFWNWNAPQLLERAVERGEGEFADGGAFVVRTGQFTGRSPRDKFIVWDELTAAGVEWGAVNHPIEEAAFDRILARLQSFWKGREAYIEDC